MAGENTKVWLDYNQKELNRQYDQRVLVPNANEYMARHNTLSEEVRARLKCRINVPYGPTPDEVVDIFPANKPGGPVAVYFHGGAWTRWHKDNNSYQAPTFVDHGISFVSVNFALVPRVTLDELVRQCRASVQWTHRNARSFGADPDKLYVAGHSSGGHVVGLLVVTDWARDWEVPADVIKGAVSVSGMYDLEPVRLSSRNEYLNLNDEAVDRLSALRQISTHMPPMVIAYGEKEQIEFRRHSKDWAAELRRLGHTVTELDMPGNNHFDMAEELAKADSPVMREAFEMIGV